jgi:hypothetical protein
MSLSAKEIEEGKFYLAARKQVRHVLQVGEKIVKYEVENRKGNTEAIGMRVTVTMGRFLDEADREVPQDFNPEVAAEEVNIERAKEAAEEDQAKRKAKKEAEEAAKKAGPDAEA